MTRPIVIIGCGGFGREVQDVIEAVNAVGHQWDLLGYVDDSPSETNLDLVARRGSTVLGGTDWFEAASTDVQYLIGIGTGSVRRILDTRLAGAGFSSPVLVHPSATLGGDVRLGPGTIVCAGVRMTTNIETGRHVHLNINTTIGHDSVLHDYATINPLVAVSGDVTIGEEVMMGTHSSVLQGLTIGARSIAGAGSCVVRDVPPDVVVKGVPAR